MENEPPSPPAPPVISSSKRRKCRHKLKTQITKADEVNTRVEANNVINMAIVSDWGADLTAERAEKVIERLGDIFDGWLIEKGKDSDIKFEGEPLYCSEEAAIRILCSNSNSVEWLQKTIASMDPLWENSKLLTKKWNEVSFVKCGLRIHQIDSDIGKLCKVLIKCNPDYQIDQWRLLEYARQEDKYLLMVGVPENIFENKVFPNGYKVNHLLGTMDLIRFTD